MSATDAIWSALDTHLTNMVGVPDVIFENAPPFDPAQGATYVEVEFRPTSRRPVVIGADPEKRYQGLYEVRVCTPRHRGSSAARDIAALVEERFDGHARISGVDVTVNVEYSEQRQGFVREPFYCIPVLIAWYSHAE